MKKFLSSQTITLVVLYLVSAVGAYALWPGTTSGEIISPQSSKGSTSEPITQGGQVIPDEPKTEVCPLNGALYGVSFKKLWETRRPMGVMIENHLDARPQSGLSSADIVYESVAEGGITRFMGIYYCDAAYGNITLGPVRSARTYFLDWVSEYGGYPIYVHVGGGNTPNKANALGQIEDYGWAGQNDMNQFGLSIKECKRDYTRVGKDNIATEHTMYCFTKSIWDLAEKRKFGAVNPVAKKGDWQKLYTPWAIAKSEPTGTTNASKVSFDFWKDYEDYHVDWNYNADKKVYERSNAGQAHIDFNTKQTLAATTVITQFMKETGPIDEVKHMLYGTIGKGDAIIFTRGQAEKVTWTKKDRLSRTVFTKTNGQPYQFQAGKIWIEILALNTPVSYN